MKPSLRSLLVSAAVVSTSLVAVSAVSATTTSHGSSGNCSASLVTANKPVTITFWESAAPAYLQSATSGTGNEAVLTKLVNAFNTAEAGKIVVDATDEPSNYGSYTTLWNSYNTDPTDELPNVMMADQYDADAASLTGSFEPISSCISENKVNTSKFSKKEMNSFTVGGKLIAMPFSASVPIMYYNENAFTDAHISKPPTTMAQLLSDQAILQKTNWTYTDKKGNKSSGTFSQGVTIQNDSWELTSWLGLANQDVVNNNNGHSGQATSTSFANSSVALAYLTDLQDIAKADNYGNVSAPTGSTEYNNLIDVGNGTSAITFGTTADLGTVDSDLFLFPAIKLGVAPLPTIPGDTKGGMPSGGNGLYISTANSTPAQIAASYEFIQYLTTAANLAAWDSGTGYLPVRSDEVSLWEKDLKKSVGKTGESWFETGYNVLTKGPTNAATEGPLINEYTGVGQAINDALGGLLNGSLTPAEALSQAASVSNSCMSNADTCPTS